MFYENLKRLCFERGISLSKLAVDIGVSTSTPTHWRRGIKPRASMVKTIADYFGVSTENLLAEGTKEWRDPVSGLTQEESAQLGKELLSQVRTWAKKHPDIAAPSPRVPTPLRHVAAAPADTTHKSTGDEFERGLVDLISKTAAWAENENYIDMVKREESNKVSKIVVENCLSVVREHQSKLPSEVLFAMGAATNSIVGEFLIILQEKNRYIKVLEAKLSETTADGVRCEAIKTLSEPNTTAKVKGKG